MKLVPTLIAMAAVALAACGQVGGNAAVPTPISPPTGALAAWASFPADQKPRPIVWLENFSPANGFASGDSKMAAYCNKYALGAPLPTNVPSKAVVTWTDGTSASYRGISAADALVALTAASSATPDPQCAAIPPLVINGARLGTVDFETDRSRAKMTSWLFSAIGVNGEMAYPALVPAAFWTGHMIGQFSNGSAAISSDGRSLSITFAGAPDTPGPCGGDYKGVVAESGSAVAVAMQEIPHAAPDDNVACPAIAQERVITVTLASPLGGRVFVDANGNAEPVCLATLNGIC
jgi:hypothetical protein